MSFKDLLSQKPTDVLFYNNITKKVTVNCRNEGLMGKKVQCSNGDWFSMFDDQCNIHLRP